MNLNFDRKLIAFKLRQAGDAQRNIFNAIPGVHWFIAVLFAVMLVAVSVTLVKVKLVSAALHTTTTANPTLAYKLSKTPLTAPEYKNVLEWYHRLHPEVSFEQPKEGGLLVFVKDGNKHSDWLFALASLQSRDADVVWEADSFCVGRCAGGSAVAVIKAYRQKMVQEK